MLKVNDQLDGFFDFLWGGGAATTIAQAIQAMRLDDLAATIAQWDAGRVPSQSLRNLWKGQRGYWESQLAESRKLEGQLISFRNRLALASEGDPELRKQLEEDPLWGRIRSFYSWRSSQEGLAQFPRPPSVDTRGAFLFVSKLPWRKLNKLEMSAGTFIDPRDDEQPGKTVDDVVDDTGKKKFKLTPLLVAAGIGTIAFLGVMLARSRGVSDEL